VSVRLKNKLRTLSVSGELFYAIGMYYGSPEKFIALTGKNCFRKKSIINFTQICNAYFVTLLGGGLNWAQLEINKEYLFALCFKAQNSQGNGP
jgi:hypothetical protein